MVLHISIVGSAGRSVSEKISFNAEVFQQIMDHAKYMIMEVKRRSPNEPIVLVSGGSAWVDHIAVKLFLLFQLEDMSNVVGLKLYLPCNFVECDKTNSIFFDVASKEGIRLNDLHREFSAKFHDPSNSFGDLYCVKALDASFQSFPGFFARNKEVAKSDILFAYTWGRDFHQPKEGGTLNIWQISRTFYKYHFPIPMIMKNSVYNPLDATIKPHRGIQDWLAPKEESKELASLKENNCK